MTNRMKDKTPQNMYMWNLEKVKQFIADGIEENIHLDYKGSGSIDKTPEKKKEIAKDVSAFANSDGGTIIYGVKEYDEKEKRHLPETIDFINGRLYSKEWLEQVINSSISPRIEGLIITPLQVDSPEKNQVIYVVDIPKSNTAHQAKDKRYYKRFNFESTAMEDWEIKDLMNRNIKTDFKLSFETRPSKEKIREFLSGDFNFEIELDICVTNIGQRIVKYLACFVKGNSDTAQNIIVPISNETDFSKVYKNTIERILILDDKEIIIGVDRNPLLPNTGLTLTTYKIRSEFIKNNCQLDIQISTEDNSKFFEINGREIIED